MADEPIVVNDGAGTPADSTPVVTPSAVTPQPASTPAAGADGKPAGDQAGNGGGDLSAKMVPYSALRDARATIASLKAEKAARSIVGDSPAVTPANDDKGGAGSDPSQFVTRGELHQERRVDALATEATQVAQEHDGSDGYPSFDLDKVTDFMKETGVRSYRYAYSLLNQDAIVEAEKAKAVKEALKVNTPQTTTPAGGSAFSNPPANGELTREAIAKMSPEQYKKLGGAAALKTRILGGTLK